MNQQHTTTLRHGLLASLSLTALLLGACGTKDAAIPATQVAARVGSEEISVHQINAALAQSGSRGSTPEQVKVMTTGILEGLIDQQVAVDQAVEAKLNRDPDVIAQIEASRRAVLASAYVKSFVASLPKPDDQDAKKYFADNPALFSERRIFNVQEMVIVRTPEVLRQVESMVAANRPMEDISAWLKANNVNFKPASANRAAEQIPLELLPKLHALKDGQITSFTSPEFVTVLRLVSSQSVPVTEALALPRIAQYLSNQRITGAVTAQMKALRAKTTVVYMGEFANASAAPASAPEAGGLRSTLEKGVAGLK